MRRLLTDLYVHTKFHWNRKNFFSRRTNCRDPSSRSRDTKSRINVKNPTRKNLVTFCMSRRRRKMCCGHACMCVCLSTAVRPHYCMDPDVTWGHGRGCPLVEHYWADLQSGHGLLWQHNANPSYKLASILRYDDIVRTADWAGSVRAAGRWLAGDGGVL